VTILNESSSTYNSATLTATESSTPITGVACTFDPSNSNLTGYEQSLRDDIKLRGKWFLLYSEVPVKIGDAITFGGRKFKIHAATSIGPDGGVIIQRLATEEIS
jgi:hypothetical protein